MKGKGSANALAAKLKTRRLRTAVGAVVFVGMAAGLVAGVSMGTMSGFGWDTFSMLCLGRPRHHDRHEDDDSPRAVVSLVLIAALVFVFGRAFCSWLCPTMLIDRIRDFFRSPKKRREFEEKKNSEIKAISQQELASLKAARTVYPAAPAVSASRFITARWTRATQCSAALLSTAVFGSRCSASCVRWASRLPRCSSSGAPSPTATRPSGSFSFRPCSSSNWWCCGNGAPTSARFRPS